MVQDSRQEQQGWETSGEVLRLHGKRWFKSLTLLVTGLTWASFKGCWGKATSHSLEMFPCRLCVCFPSGHPYLRVSHLLLVWHISHLFCLPVCLSLGGSLLHSLCVSLNSHWLPVSLVFFFLNQSLIIFIMFTRVFIYLHLFKALN